MTCFLFALDIVLPSVSSVTDIELRGPIVFLILASYHKWLKPENGHNFRTKDKFSWSWILYEPAALFHLHLHSSVKSLQGEIVLVMCGGSLGSLHGCCLINPWKHAYWTLIWAKKAYFSMVRARKAKIVYMTPRLGLRLLKMAHICHSIFLKRRVCLSPATCEGSRRQFLDFWILAIFHTYGLKP